MTRFVPERTLRIFLASPGDLQDERRLGKRIVDEFNSLWADSTGYHVELIGWEDTVASYGRPQALINNDLDRCELFIGMIWKRWGTLPDLNGIYTSGFEEELQRSIDNKTRAGKPSISLFFKYIDQESLRDPGQQLKHVIAFRENVIARKELYFEEFRSANEFEDKFRRCVTRYVQNLLALDRSESVASQSSIEREQTGDRSAKTIPSAQYSTEGASFLSGLVSRYGDQVQIRPLTVFDAARLRLLSSICRYTDNDEQVLGVHDANIIYNSRNLSVFGRDEIGG